MEKHPPIIVAIGCQVGSGGTELGERLARRLNFAYLDRQIMQEAARQLGLREEDLLYRKERVAGFWERLGSMLSLGTPGSVWCDFKRVPEIAEAVLSSVEIEAMRKLAADRDSILIGHAGFHCLRDMPGLLRIFTHAGRGFRLRRMTGRYQIADRQEAGATIDRTDREREQFVHRVAGVLWTDARNYDLCLNLSIASLECAEEMVIALIDQKRAALKRCGEAAR